MAEPSHQPSPEEILLRLIKEGKSPKVGEPAGQEPVGPAGDEPVRPEPIRKEFASPKPAPRESSQRPLEETIPPEAAVAPSPPTPPARKPAKIPLGMWAGRQRKQRVQAGAGRGSVAVFVHALAGAKTLREKVYGEIDLIPRIFLLLSLILAGFVFFNIFNDRVQSHKRLEKLWANGSRMAIHESKTPVALAPKMPGEGLPEKDLFKFMEEPPPVAARTPPAPTRVASLDRIIANYILSGIIGGDQPQAVIEDKAQGKTYFLSIGDTLGDMRIVAIEEGKVTVALGNEQAVLIL